MDDGLRQRHHAASSSTAKRGPGFTQVEVTALLGVLESVLPVSSDEWETVAHRHQHNGFPDRNADSLRRKYSKLVRVRGASEGGRVHPHVKRAKRIRSQMAAKAKFGPDDERTRFAPMLPELEDDHDGDADANANGEPRFGDDSADAMSPATAYGRAASSSSRPVSNSPGASRPHEEELTRLVHLALVQGERDRRELTRLVQTALTQAEQDRRERADERRQWQQAMQQRDEMMRAAFAALTSALLNGRTGHDDLSLE